MTTPLAKTWQYGTVGTPQAFINQNFAGSAYRTGLRALVDSLLGFSFAPWVCQYSCGFNGTSQVAGSAGDGVNRWTNDAALVYVTSSSGVRSWIVLKQANILSNFQILIDLQGGTAFSTAQIYMSPSAGFTGGSTTARPTATDEIVAGTSGNGAWTGNVGVALRIHVLMSSDGQATYVFTCAGGNIVSCWIFARLQGARAAITQPFVGGVVCAGSAVSITTIATLNGSANLRGKFASTVANLYLTGEGAGGTLIGSLVSTADDIEGAFALTPVALFSATSGAKGRYGQLPDLFWGASGANNGDQYPDTPPIEFGTMRDLVIPSPGVIYQTA